MKFGQLVIKRSGHRFELSHGSAIEPVQVCGHNLGGILRKLNEARFSLLSVFIKSSTEEA